jgi:hypothetical protein
MELTDEEKKIIQRMKSEDIDIVYRTNAVWHFFREQNRVRKHKTRLSFISNADALNGLVIKEVSTVSKRVSKGVDIFRYSLNYPKLKEFGL